MGKIKMLGYQITEQSFKNALPGGSKINIAAKHSYNVRYGDQNRCRGELVTEVYDKENPDKFNIKVVICGVFVHDGSIDKPHLHVETYKAIFPYARSFVAMMTAACGIPALMIPEIDIESQEIISFNNPSADK